MKENSFDLSNIAMVAPSSEVPDVQVIYEGKQRDMGRCLRKFAKKIFYLQKQVELLIQEKNKWKAECEISDKNHKEVKVKYEEILEVLKLNEKKGQEMRIETEKYKTISVSLEEELARLKAFPPAEPEIQIIEKIIEKPIEIIKHVILEKIIEKPIEIIKTIEVPPVEIEKLIEKIVEVPVEKIVEKIVNVPHEIIVEKIVEVPKIEIIEREKIVEVPRIEYVDRVVTVEKPIYIEKPTQIQREMVEVRNEGAERELSFLREDFRRLQLCLEQSQHEIEDWREKYNQSQENLHIGDSNAAIHFERERVELIEELRGNRETISDLRQRIELLYKEITTLSEQNNRKNLDMTNQIRLLEDQLFTFAPRLISNTTTHYAHLPAQVFAESPIQIQNLSPVQSYPSSSQVINPNLYVQQPIQSGSQQQQQQQQQQQSQSQYQINSQTQQVRGSQPVNQNQGGQSQYQQDQIKKQVAFSAGIQQQASNDQLNNDMKSAQPQRQYAPQYPPSNRPLNENGLRYIL